MVSAYAAAIFLFAITLVQAMVLPASSRTGNDLEERKHKHKHKPTYSGGTMSGDGTYYDAGLGACGNINSNSDYVVALSIQIFQQKYCGKSISIYCPMTGNRVTATVEDACVGCAFGSVDMTPTVFSQLADMSLGRIKVTWGKLPGMKRDAVETATDKTHNSLSDEDMAEIFAKVEAAESSNDTNDTDDDVTPE